MNVYTAWHKYSFAFIWTVLRSVTSRLSHHFHLSPPENHFHILPPKNNQNLPNQDVFQLISNLQFPMKRLALCFKHQLPFSLKWQPQMKLKNCHDSVNFLLMVLNELFKLQISRNAFFSLELLPNKLVKSLITERTS